MIKTEAISHFLLGFMNFGNLTLASRGNAGTRIFTFDEYLTIARGVFLLKN